MVSFRSAFTTAVVLVSSTLAQDQKMECLYPGQPAGGTIDIEELQPTLTEACGIIKDKIGGRFKIYKDFSFGPFEQQFHEGQATLRLVIQWGEECTKDKTEYDIYEPVEGLTCEDMYMNLWADCKCPMPWTQFGTAN